MGRVLMDAEMLNMIVALVVAGIYLVMLAILLIGYILTAKSLHTIGNRRGIANSWLAWIPVADSWIVGSIADGHDEKLGFARKWRYVLTTLSVIGFGGIVIGYAGFFGMIISVAFRYAPAEPPLEEWLAPFLVFYVLLIVAAVVMMVAAIVRQICIFKIYESTVPEKAVKYLLLSLLVPLAGPICLYRCRNKGYGEETAEMALQRMMKERDM